MKREARKLFELLGELGYTKEESLNGISSLLVTQQRHLQKRYGEDYNQKPKTKGEMDKKEYVAAANTYQTLKKKMIELYGEREGIVTPEELQHADNGENTAAPVPEPNPDTGETTVPKEKSDTGEAPVVPETPADPGETPVEVEASKLSTDIKAAMVKLLNYRTMTELSVKYQPFELVVCALRLGYIEGRIFSIKAIAEFFGKSEEEIQVTVNNCLLSDPDIMLLLANFFIQLAAGEPIEEDKTYGWCFKKE